MSKLHDELKAGWKRQHEALLKQREYEEAGCPVDGIKTRVWHRGGYIKINLDHAVKTMRLVYVFCMYNNLRDSCIVKLSGGYYHLGYDGILTKQFTHLDGVTFRELYHMIKRQDLISSRLVLYDPIRPPQRQPRPATSRWYQQPRDSA